MTQIFHLDPSHNAFDRKRQLAELDYVVSSEAASRVAGGELCRAAGRGCGFFGPERQAGRSVQVLVVGAGVVGLAIAREAALAATT